MGHQTDKGWNSSPTHLKHINDERINGLAHAMTGQVVMARL